MRVLSMLAHAQCLTDAASFAASDGYTCADWGAEFDANGGLASQGSTYAAEGFSHIWLSVCIVTPFRFLHYSPWHERVGHAVLHEA